MSIQAVGWVLDHSKSRGLARLVLISLANAVNKDADGECWPSMRTIAGEAGVSLGTIPSKIDELVALGEVVVVDRGTKRRSARYRLTHLSVQDANAESSGDELRVQRRSEQNRKEPKEHSPTESTSLFEAFYEFWTGRRYVEALELPKSMRGRLNAAVKEARLAGISAEAVRNAGRRYRDTWSRMERTPQALLANWSRFGLEDEPVADCETCGNRGLIWFGPDGERRAADDVDADTAAHCPDCHPEAI